MGRDILRNPMPAILSEVATVAISFQLKENPQERCVDLCVLDKAGLVCEHTFFLQLLHFNQSLQIYKSGDGRGWCVWWVREGKKRRKSVRSLFQTGFFQRAICVVCSVIKPNTCS